MIRSNLRRLRTEKESREARKLTYEVMVGETGLANTTLQRLLDFDGISRIDGRTLDTLCRYFSTPGEPVGVGDILEYVPEEGATA